MAAVEALSSPSIRIWALALGRGGGYLSRFLNLEKGGFEGSSYLEFKARTVYRGPLLPPRPHAYVPPPQLNNGRTLLALRSQGAHRGQQEAYSIP